MLRVFSEKRQARLKSVAAARLSRLGLAGHPALYICLEQEGYADYVFGCRAGPAYDLNNLFHELAHAAEFGPQAFRTRAWKGRFVFKVKRVFVLGQFYSEPTTCEATLRELRTFAHQFALLRSAGVKTREDVFFREAVRSMRYMPDWYNVPGKTEEAQMRYCAQKARSFYRALKPGESLERLRGWLDLSAKRLKRLGNAEGTPKRPSYAHRQVWRLGAQAQWAAA